MTTISWRRLALVSWFLAVVSLVLAIIFYRGGSTTASNSFHWTINFLSDLGRIRDYNNRAQPFVRGLFIVAMISLAATLVGLGQSFQISISNLLSQKVVGWLAMMGALAAAMIGLISEDYNLTIHRFFLVLLVISLAPLWTILSRNLQNLSEFIKGLTIFTTIILWAYVLFLIFAPRPEVNALASSVQAQVEKSVVVIVLVNVFSLLVTNLGVDK